MKAKELKILRKALVKANRCEELLKGFGTETVLSVNNNANYENKLSECSGHNRKYCISIIFSLSRQMTENRFKECLGLFEKNMAEMYINSSWGLNMEEKSAELKDDKARFLLALDDDKKLSGFVHFRFEYDDQESPTCGVLYIYEIQIESIYRRCGVGRRLMRMAQRIAKEQSMTKILLTVFKKNRQAMTFYRDKLGYGIDESSPSKFGDHDVDYEILSLKIS